jgi:hypothetical protein
MTAENKSLENNIDPANLYLSRREFIKGVGIVGAGALLIAACGGGDLDEILEAKTEEEKGEEKKKKAIIKSGFNSHVSAKATEIENLTPEAFREDVDKMAEYEMKTVRLNVWEWELDDESLEIYKEALEYAKDKGLEVHLVTNVPQLSKDGSEIETDIEKVRSYYQRMAQKFIGLVDVWQFFNEADDHKYANYSRIENEQVYPLGYLENFGKLVATANETVRSIDPETKTTVNVSIWNNVEGDLWIDDQGKVIPRFEEVGIFDAACGFEPGGAVDTICTTIDFISLDIYFDTDYKAIEKLPELIRYFQGRYDKPVVVSEVGIPTSGDGRFTPLDQVISISRIINVLQQGEVRPDAILLYEMRDERMKAPSDPEGHFGFHDYGGNPKEGFDEVLEAIKEDEGLNE